MKILFLTPYPLKEAPSQRFRFEQYFSFLLENGCQIVSQSFWDEKTWAILYKSGYSSQKIMSLIYGFGRRIKVLFQLSNIDFVFIHRECLPIGPPIIEWIISKVLQKKIVYDFDDAIWIPNTSQENKAVAFLKWHSKVESICKWSYKVSCGNSFLADFALRFNSHVTINPTTIDTTYLHNPDLYKAKDESNSTIIGWTGTQSTLPYLDPLMPVFEKIENKFKGQVRLLIIANKNPALKLEFVDFIQWSKQTEIEDLLRIDIGIMPLPGDAWANGKCGFKALQYMALEIPTVAAPVGVNATIIDDGINGFLASDQNEWINALEQLILDTILRKKVGSKGREKVITHYSVLSNSATFLSLFGLA
ncbi:MAG: glycosyltransferase family 4 protein [Cyclobacteriaceae bacterium]|nr:glycosyltransferase family 4 protein [Cyclobacteriaceae bacterium]